MRAQVAFCVIMTMSYILNAGGGNHHAEMDRGQQRDAIADRGHSLIVCAAAGSGKTAVLVERIVQLVREGCPIENMLVVTFTNAAAGEMRQRIGEALGRAAREEPALGEQVMALSRASISTLHRFCGKPCRASTFRR